MPDLTDFLPMPPWEGPPLPRGLVRQAKGNPYMELGELKARLERYKSLTDLTERLNYPPPPKLALRCRECSKVYESFQPNWGEVEIALRRNSEWLRTGEIKGLCPECLGEEEEEEE